MVKKVILINVFKGELDVMSVVFIVVRDKFLIVLIDGNIISFVIDGLEIYVIGGKVSMSDKLINEIKVIRIGGVDRYDINK